MSQLNHIVISLTTPNAEPLSRDVVVTLFVSFTVAWGILSFFLHKRYSDRGEYASRVIALLHAFISLPLLGFAALQYFPERYIHVPETTTTTTTRRQMDGIEGDSFSSLYRQVSNTFGAFLALLVGTPWAYNADFTRSFGDVTATPLQQVACLFSSAYFLVDLLGILFGSYFDFLFCLHHLVSGGCLFYVGFGPRVGFDMTLSGMMLEASNPFLHSRWFYAFYHSVSMRHKNQKSKKKTKKPEPLTNKPSTSPPSTSSTLLHEMMLPVEPNSIPPPIPSAAWRFLDDGWFVVYTLMRVLVGPFITFLTIFAPTTPMFIKFAAFMVEAASIEYYVRTIKRRSKNEFWM